MFCRIIKPSNQTQRISYKVIHTNLQAGQATFHRGLLVHSSPSNRSAGRRRCGLTAQYVTQKSTSLSMGYNNAYEDDWRKPVLVAGEDRFERINYTSTMYQLYSTLKD